MQAIPAAKYDNSYDLRRPTGLLSLDIALGGGFPAGGSSQVYGTRSSGKTHLCYCIAGQVQKNYGDEAIIAVGISEMLADIGFMRMSGFCVRYSEDQINKLESNRVAHGRAEFSDEEREDLRSQIGQVLFLSGTTGGDLLESTLEVADRMASRCQLMIIDSLGSLLTPDQDEKTVSDKHYGGSAGIITLWQTKMQPKFAFRDGAPLLETTIIGINQVRQRIGGPIPGATREAASSESWKHAQLINLECKQGEPLWQDSKHAVQSGRTVKWNIKKGKAGTHEGHKGEFNWYFFKKDGEDVHEPIFWKDVQGGTIIGGADKITDLVETAKSLGIVEIGGAWRTVKDQDGKVLIRTQGDEALAEKLVGDPELEGMLKEGCLRAPNLNIRYR
jgi:RecA/RadA recombinase